MAWFEPVAIATTAARLGLRSEASARFERGVDPIVIDAAIARFVELLRETSPGVRGGARRSSTRAACCRRRHGCGCAPARVNALLGIDAHRWPTSRRCSTRSASPSTVATASTRWRCRRGGPTAPSRSTSSRRWPATTATSASGKTCRRRPTPAASPRCSTTGACVRQVLVGAGAGRGHADARCSRPATSPGPGCRATAIALTNPMVAEESMLRHVAAARAAEGDRLQRVAPQPPVSALFELGHVYLPARGRRAAPGRA